jgi:isobutyryl-CoA mutase
VKIPEPYKPVNHIRIVTAASLFDGHDAAINIMRRILQASGAEVIHLGHNRAVQEIVDCAIQEDVQAIALTSYQGGHLEFLKYMYDLLRGKGCGHIRIFAGGGGVILPHEIRELHEYGISRVYSPDDGRSMSLQGMINDLLEKCDFALDEGESPDTGKIPGRDFKHIARLITLAENHPEKAKLLLDTLQAGADFKKIPVLGVTGTGGAGKSSLVDELVRRYLGDLRDKTIAIISVDPTKRKTGGALLGDRIRMNAIFDPRAFMRSLATRQSNLALSRYVKDATLILQAAGFDLILIESSGIGQSDTEIVDHSNLSMYVMTPEYGAASQLEKIDMLDFADMVVVNKSDKRGAPDAIRDVKKQYQRNHKLFDREVDEMPVYGTVASQFNDPGVNKLYKALVGKLNEVPGAVFSSSFTGTGEMKDKILIIPPSRTRYLSEIAEAVRTYNRRTGE